MKIIVEVWHPMSLSNAHTPRIKYSSRLGQFSGIVILLYANISLKQSSIFDILLILQYCIINKNVLQMRSECNLNIIWTHFKSAVELSTKCITQLIYFFFWKPYKIMFLRI